MPGRKINCQSHIVITYIDPGSLQSAFIVPLPLRQLPPRMLLLAPGEADDGCCPDEPQVQDLPTGAHREATSTCWCPPQYDTHLQKYLDSMIFSRLFILSLDYDPQVPRVDPKALF